MASLVTHDAADKAANTSAAASPDTEAKDGDGIGATEHARGDTVDREVHKGVTLGRDDLLLKIISRFDFYIATTNAKAALVAAFNPDPAIVT